MENPKLLFLYNSYLQSFACGFGTLYHVYQRDYSLDCFFSMANIFADYLELYFKYMLIASDGFPENNSIRSFNLDTHDFQILMSEDCIYYLDFLNLDHDKINTLEEKINALFDLLGTKELSHIFRYPCDKNNNIYLSQMGKKHKMKCLASMHEILLLSVDLLKQYHAKLILYLDTQYDEALKTLERWEKIA